MKSVKSNELESTQVYPLQPWELQKEKDGYTDKEEDEEMKLDNVGQSEMGDSGIKLTIELVPETVFFKNVRSEVSKEKWDIIRRKAYQKANYKCGICGGVGNRHPVECHEVWEYDDEKHIQTLKGFIALCPRCHGVKHIGLSQMRGLYDNCVEHLAKVNGWKEKEAEKYVEKCFGVWEERSTHDWKLNTKEVLDEVR